MRLETHLNEYDRDIVARAVDGFVPDQIFDFHAHLIHDGLFAPGSTLPYMGEGDILGFAEYRAAMERWMPGRKLDTLFFGFPRINNKREEIDHWIAEEVGESPSQASRSLALVSPSDDPEKVAERMQRLGLVGLKPYHTYALMENTMNAKVEEFASEWMWELCHQTNGVLMLHIVRDRAIADAENIASLRRLCRTYPGCRVILAHVARSFCYRHALEGLHHLRDLDNVWVDTSAVTEPNAMRKAIEVLGPKRVLFGTDYPLSDLRGKCTATGDRYYWIYAEAPKPKMPWRDDLTLIGIESLLSLREACEESGLTAGDVEDIFRNNALRLLAPHMKAAEGAAISEPLDGGYRNGAHTNGAQAIGVHANGVHANGSSENGGLAKGNLSTETPPEAEAVTGGMGTRLWEQALTRISGGSNLVSKWAERYDSQSWPTYFSRCHGYNVWDLEGRRFADFHGGIGAVLLGYNDPDVGAAVRRRMDAGPFCNLVTPDEVTLADELLELHPWAGRVRYARGGGEAMTVAVRTARAATGKSGVVFCGYHGWHDWYLAANLGDESNLDGHLLPGLQPLGVPRELTGTAVGFSYNDLASFEEALAKLEGRVAAIVMEPMRSFYPEPGFLETVAARCREIGAVLVFDEVTSGWRFGFPGAWNYLGVEPDIAVYAKATTNGFPGGAIIGREELMVAAQPSFISSTYWTDGIAPAAALATIHKMRSQNVQQYVWGLGEKLQKSLNELMVAYPLCRLQLNGTPAVSNLVFDLGEDSMYARILLIRKMAARGFLASGLFFLMQAHDEAVISSMLTALDEVLGEISELVETDRLREETGEVRARAGFRRLV